MGANQLLNCLLARKPKPAHRAALQLWCPCGVGSSSAPTRPSLFCAPIQAVRVAPQGSCVGFVPVCAGTCAGLLLRKSLIVNSVPVCRVNTPAGVGSRGGSVRRPERERGCRFASANRASLSSSCQKRICALL
jgi:hypothetical protein